jgi:hypothetical protein
VRTVPVRLLVIVSLFVGACAGESASPTPAGSSAVLQELTRAGFRIRGAVAGDPGCDDESLAGNATRLRIAFTDDQPDKDLYLFIFRVRDYAGEAAKVDACQAAVEAAMGSSIDRVDVAPYRAFGGQLPSAWRDALARALSSASRGGASP